MKCHTFQQRKNLSEAINTGRGDSYWNIDFFGEALRTTNVAGGEYLRSCESLTVKYNGEAAVLGNFEATATTVHLPTTTHYVPPKGVRPTAKSTAVTDVTTPQIDSKAADGYG